MTPHAPFAPPVACPPPRRILLICIRYLGDSLLLRPCLEAAKRAFPDASVEALVAQGTGVALDPCPHLDRLWEWPRSQVIAQARLILAIRASRFDWVVDHTGNDRSAFLAWISRAPVRACYQRPARAREALRNRAFTLLVPPEKPKPHIIQQRLHLLAACGVPAIPPTLTLQPTPTAAEWAETQYRQCSLADRPVLHVHLSSRDMQKSLPVSLVRAVLALLSRDPELRFVWTHGPASAERAFAQDCLAELPAGRAQSVTNISWHQLVALIARATAYWGADTAPTHAAWALNRPGLVHFGPSHSTHWRPWTDNAHALISPCPCLAKRASLPCPPGRPGRCFDALDPSDIATRLTTALRTTQEGRG